MTSCRILLVNTPTFPEIPPFHVMSLASYLRNKGHIVKIVDLALEDDISSMVNYFQPQVVGISAMSCNINLAYSLGDSFKKYRIYTVIGGKHASVFPKEAIEHCNAVVIGEGEITLSELVESRANGIFNGELIKDLDTLPLPAYDLSYMSFYSSIRNRIFNSLYSFVLPFDKVGTVISSRGCPFKCTFCYNSGNISKYRCKSPEKTFEEVKFLYDNYGVNSIHFHDDHMLSNKKKLSKLCDMFIESKLPIYWSANARADHITEDIVEMMYNANCGQLAFGFESGSQRILDKLDKGITIEQIREAVRIVDKNNMVTQACFMVGSPTETLDEAKATKALGEELAIDGGLGAAICTPYPGTKLWDWCIDNGLSDIKNNIDYNNLTYGKIVVNMSAMTNVELDKISNETLCSFNDKVRSNQGKRMMKIIKIKEKFVC
jgi:radical SAM superfamily enzyme YgiQ (UPF0313 family)